MNISIPHLKAHMVLEVRAAQRATPICTSRGASQKRELSPDNVRRQGTLHARDSLPHNFNIGLFESSKK